MPHSIVIRGVTCSWKWFTCSGLTFVHTGLGNTWLYNAEKINQLWDYQKLLLCGDFAQFFHMIWRSIWLKKLFIWNVVMFGIISVDSCQQDEGPFSFAWKSKACTCETLTLAKLSLTQLSPSKGMSHLSLLYVLQAKWVLTIRLPASCLCL